MVHVSGNPPPPTQFPFTSQNSIYFWCFTVFLFIILILSKYNLRIYLQTFKSRKIFTKKVLSLDKLYFEKNELINYIWGHILQNIMVLHHQIPSFDGFMIILVVSKVSYDLKCKNNIVETLVTIVIIPCFIILYKLNDCVWVL